MSNTSKSVEIWESAPVDFEVSESYESEVDGKYILAKIVGPSFFPETVSRNNVHYPLEAWENAISNETFQARLRDRLVFGTIGHDIELKDDEIREGKISHIVSRVWIDDDGIGKAEYLILNTGPGATLNTLLRAGSKLRVSTKAEGQFTRGPNGGKSVAPSSFALDRIDFVIDPGYRDALPILIESLNSENSPHEVKEMADLSVTTILESNLAEARQTTTSLRENLATVQESLSAANVEKARLESTLEGYRSFGTVAALQESMSELDQYRNIGTVHELHESLDAADKALTDLTSTLSETSDELEQVRNLATQNDDYDELGSPSEVRDALEAAENIIDELKAYRELGTVEELTALLDRAQEMTESLEQQELEALAAKYNVGLDVVKSLCDKCETVEEAEQLLMAIKGDKPEDAPAAPAQEECAVREDDDDGEGEELERAPVAESMTSRLLNRSHKFASTRKITESKKLDSSAPLSARLMGGKQR